MEIGINLGINKKGDVGGGTDSGWNDLGTSILLSANNTVATNPGTDNLAQYVKSHIGHSTGYYYAEVVLTEQGNGNGQIAIGVAQGSPAQTWLGNNAGTLGAWAGGDVYTSGNVVRSASGFGEGDVMRIWVRDGQRIWLEYHDGVSGTMIGGGNPDANNKPSYIFTSSGDVYIAATPYGQVSSPQSAATLRTKQSEFDYFYTGLSSPDAWE